MRASWYEDVLNILELLFLILDSFLLRYDLYNNSYWHLAPSSINDECTIFCHTRHYEQLNVADFYNFLYSTLTGLIYKPSYLCKEFSISFSPAPFNMYILFLNVRYVEDRYICLVNILVLIINLEHVPLECVYIMYLMLKWERYLDLAVIWSRIANIVIRDIRRKKLGWWLEKNSNSVRYKMWIPFDIKNVLPNEVTKNH